MRRARREDARQGVRWIVSWMHLEDVTVGAIEPGDDDDVFANRDASERSSIDGIDLEPCIGRALRTLTRRGGERAKGRADAPDRTQCILTNRGRASRLLAHGFCSSAMTFPSSSFTDPINLPPPTSLMS